MKAITEKIHKAGLEKLKPLIVRLVKEGANQNTIVQTSKRYTESKINKYYNRIKEPQRLNTVLPGVVTPLRDQGDSNAEVVFYHLLKENDFSFEFQYKIGQYRVDYLISENLIIELDGPLHNKRKDEIKDKYLKKMGYRIIRIPIFILALAPEAVIDEIRGAI